MADETPGSLWRRDGEIFLVSVLILYLEMVLIRWIGTEIRVFAYLGNLILVVCFFGVGLGCYLFDRKVSFTRLGVNLLLLAVLVSNPLHLQSLDLRDVTDWLAGFEDSPLWEMFITPRLLIGVGLVVVGVFMYLVLSIFLPTGQLLGRALQEHPASIRAYSANIAGSLAGVWLFNALSRWGTPPQVWLSISAALLAGVLIATAGRQWTSVGLVALAALAVWHGQKSDGRTIWSPYQKLTLNPVYLPGKFSHVQAGYRISANDIGYQMMVNLSDDFLSAYPELFNTATVEGSHYNLPFHLKTSVRRLLIVGAGTGNNAAAALRHGVQQVDCVEIDPEIYALGKELHPEHPYDSPRVRMIIDDARAFFKRARESYDMVWFALLDTHPGSAYNNTRLDHYVYTMESFREAHRLLTQDGVLVMNFASRRPWISDRLSRMMREVFGHEIIAFQMGSEPSRYRTCGEFTMICSRQPLPLASLDRSLQAYIASHKIDLSNGTRSTTDDWPYLYLQTPKVPNLYLCAMVVLLGTVTLGGRQVFQIKAGVNWHFVMLGAAFLLLEVQTVSRATLLFGMTWVVNAIVISAVLVMVLLANLVAWWWPKLPKWMIVAGLAATVGLLAMVPLDWLNTLSGSTKLVAACGFLTAPVFFAGLIFIRSFVACADKPRALGSNLIGALVGGLLESVSFVTGIRALVMLVGAFYAIALWLRPDTHGQHGRA